MFRGLYSSNVDGLVPGPQAMGQCYRTIAWR